MAIQPKKKQTQTKVLSAEEQEAALQKVQTSETQKALPAREIYRHTIDVPAALAARIDEELKRTHLTKRGFWLKIAEDYFEARDK